MTGVDLKTAGIVALAIGAPSLLARAPTVGVPIAAYVTDAHRVAIAELDAAGMVASVPTAADMAAHRHATWKNTHPTITKQSALALCDAFLDACKAGMMSGAESAYDVFQGHDIMRGGAFDLSEAYWAKLDEQPADRLTSLGVAAAQVAKRRDGVASGFLSSAQDFASVVAAVGVLAVEMDDQGYLIAGKPERVTIAGGLGAAADAVGAFVADASVASAGAVARALGELVLGNPYVLLGASVVAWRLLR